MPVPLMSRPGTTSHRKTSLKPQLCGNNYSIKRQIAFQRKANSLAYTQIMSQHKPETSREFLKAIETQTIQTSTTGLHRHTSAKMQTAVNQT